MRPVRPVVEVRRAESRARSASAGVEVRHSFSSGWHYDPTNTSHGRLLVCDEVLLAGGAGFDEHAHRDEEVLTWVLEGALAHEDSSGRSGTTRPGVLQRMSAGRGLRHSERNADSRCDGEPVRFVQMRVAADGAGLDPPYEQVEADEALAAGTLVALASGRSGPAGAVRLACRSAVLHAARLPGGGALLLPWAPYLHVLVTRGSLELEGSDGVLDPGDEVRATAAGGPRLTAVTPAEVLVWEMHSDLR